MVFEIATLRILPDSAPEFEAAVAKAVPLFQQAQGYEGIKLERSIEEPHIYRLVVGWSRLEDHTITFRQSEDFQAWRALAGPFFASPPVVEHFHTVFARF